MEKEQKYSPQIEQTKNESDGSEQPKQSPVAEVFSASHTEEYSSFGAMKNIQIQYMDKIVVEVAGLKKGKLFTVISANFITIMLSSIIEIFKIIIPKDKTVDLNSLCLWFAVFLLSVFLLIVFFHFNEKDNEIITRIKSNLNFIYKLSKEIIDKDKSVTKVCFHKGDIDFENTRNKY